MRNNFKNIHFVATVDEFVANILLERGWVLLFVGQQSDKIMYSVGYHRYLTSEEYSSLIISIYRGSILETKST